MKLKRYCYKNRVTCKVIRENGKIKVVDLDTIPETVTEWPTL